MSSKEPPKLLDFERDIPTTPEDIRALRENRPKLDPTWIDRLTEVVAQLPNVDEARRRRRTFEGFEPFEL
jgi:hypothetical protein